MTEYLHMANSLTGLDTLALGPLLAIEQYRRARGASRAMQDWAWRDAGYCIDAPETLPAGACWGEEYDGVPIPMQVTVQRPT